jgi:hypothetical protein
MYSRRRNSNFLCVVGGRKPLRFPTVGHEFVPLSSYSAVIDYRNSESKRGTRLELRRMDKEEGKTLHLKFMLEFRLSCIYCDVNRQIPAMAAK